jgi:hypothetical protein
MNRKRIVIIIVIGFVASALGSFLGNYLRRSSEISPPRTERIVAYYFHGKARSPACASIESYVKEALDVGFNEHLKDGRLEWRSVDYEQPVNEHYAADYKLAAPCVVLVRMHGDEPIEWRNMPEVWDYVGDKATLVKCVQKNVREFLDYVAIPGACCR